MRKLKIKILQNKFFIEYKNLNEELSSFIVFNRRRNYIEALGKTESEFIKDMIHLYANITIDEINKYGFDEQESLKFKEIAKRDLRDGSEYIRTNLKEIYLVINPFNKAEFDPKLSATFINALSSKLLYKNNNFFVQIIKSIMFKVDIDLQLQTLNELDELQIKELVKELFQTMKLRKLTINNILLRL